MDYGLCCQFGCYYDVSLPLTILHDQRLRALLNCTWRRLLSLAIAITVRCPISLTLHFYGWPANSLPQYAKAHNSLLFVGLVISIGKRTSSLANTSDKLTFKLHLSLCKLPAWIVSSHTFYNSGLISLETFSRLNARQILRDMNTIPWMPQVIVAWPKPWDYPKFRHLQLKYVFSLSQHTEK